MPPSFVRVALVFASIALAGGVPRLHAQDLAPRAYTVTPRGSNAFTLANAYNDGPLLLEGAVPIEDASARLNAPSLTYYRAFSLLGRSANVVAAVGPAEMTIYAGWCGRALALAHARSGSASRLSGYMGRRDALDKAIASFSMAYADQNEKDHAALERAVRTGKVKAVFEEAK